MVVNASGSYLTAHILLVGLMQVIDEAGMKCHADERVAKQIRDLEIPTFDFPILVSLRTPPGEIHIRDAKSGELRGKIVGIYT